MDYVKKAKIICKTKGNKTDEAYSLEVGEDTIIYNSRKDKLFIYRFNEVDNDNKIFMSSINEVPKRIRALVDKIYSEIGVEEVI